MLARRIQGVMKQYGPLVAFFTTEVFLKGRWYLGQPRIGPFAVSASPVARLEDDLNWRGWMAGATLAQRIEELMQDYLKAHDWYTDWAGTTVVASRREARESSDYAEKSRIATLAQEGRASLDTDRYDVLVPWIARHVSRWLKTPTLPGGEPSFVEAALVNVQRSIDDIADWANAARPNLMPMTIPEVMDATYEWHDEMKKRATMQAATPGEIVHRFSNGWTFERLTEGEQLCAEGESQGICVGQETYVQGVASGDMRIYSLRDPMGVPHVTVEVAVRQGGMRDLAVQIKGRGNALIKSHALCRRLAEAFDALHIQYKPWGSLVVSPDWNDCDDVTHAQRSVQAERVEDRQENPMSRVRWNDAVHARGER